MQACSSVALATNSHQHMARKPHSSRNISSIYLSRQGPILNCRNYVNCETSRACTLRYIHVPVMQVPATSWSVLLKGQEDNASTHLGMYGYCIHHIDLLPSNIHPSCPVWDCMLACPETSATLFSLCLLSFQHLEGLPGHHTYCKCSSTAGSTIKISRLWLWPWLWKDNCLSSKFSILKLNYLNIYLCYVQSEVSNSAPFDMCTIWQAKYCFFHQLSSPQGVCWFLKNTIKVLGVEERLDSSVEVSQWWLFRKPRDVHSTTACQYREPIVGLFGIN